jgi:hypothetical protein
MSCSFTVRYSSLTFTFDLSRTPTIPCFIVDAGHGAQTQADADSTESDGRDENLVDENGRFIRDNVSTLLRQALDDYSPGTSTIDSD